MSWPQFRKAKKNLRHALEDLRLLTPKLVASRPELKELKRRLQTGVTSAVQRSDERVLFFAETGAWIFQQIWLGLIAKSLENRGVRCDMLLCGGQIPSCHVISGSDAVRQAPEDLCRSCSVLGLHHHEAMGLNTQSVTNFFDEKGARELDELMAQLADDDLLDFEWRGFPLGKRCVISAACLARADAKDRSPEFWEFLRRSMQGAGRMLLAFERALSQLRPTRIVLWNGLMFSQEPLTWLAKQKGIPYVTVEGGWYPDTIVLCHNDAAAENCDYEWKYFRDKPLTSTEMEEVDKILGDRRAGQSVVSHYWQNMISDTQAVREQLQLDPNRPMALICSNITWDSAVVNKEVTFPSLVEWIFSTIEWFAEHPEVDLVIRAHPAEVSISGQRESKIKIGSEIERRFPTLPPNVRLVPSTSKISTYILMDLASVGLVLSSTAGLEMAATGKPVIGVGRAHYHGKGFTLDPQTPAEYYDLMVKWSQGKLAAPENSAELAKRYTHLFIKKMMIPFPLVRMNADGTGYEILFENQEDLTPGKDPYIDLICDGILSGQPFCINFPKLSGQPAS